MTRMLQLHGVDKNVSPVRLMTPIAFPAVHAVMLKKTNKRDPKQRLEVHVT